MVENLHVFFLKSLLGEGIWRKRRSAIAPEDVCYIKGVNPV